uniref:Uncharacterized protein n=1 Tax=Oryza brachyantha TaxID=4533 RepID=J3M7N8_ORYBR
MAQTQPAVVATASWYSGVLESSGTLLEMAMGPVIRDPMDIYSIRPRRPLFRGQPARRILGPAITVRRTVTAHQMAQMDQRPTAPGTKQRGVTFWRDPAMDGASPQPGWKDARARCRTWPIRAEKKACVAGVGRHAVSECDADCGAASENSVWSIERHYATILDQDGEIIVGRAGQGRAAKSSPWFSLGTDWSTTADRPGEVATCNLET